MRRFTVVTLLIASACGGAQSPVSDGSTTVVGIGSTSGYITTNFKAVEARAATENSTATFPDGSTHYLARVYVVMSNVNNVCSVLESGVAPPGMTRVVAAVQISDLSAAPVVPGTYAIGSVSADGTWLASADLETFSATQCKENMWEVAKAGTITLSTITADEVSGALDITMADGTHVTGAFTTHTQCAPQSMVASLSCM